MWGSGHWAHLGEGETVARLANNHSALAARYNRDWDAFFVRNPNPTATTILQFNTSMKIIYRDYYRC